jgi:hypothetical protein
MGSTYHYLQKINVMYFVCLGGCDGFIDNVMYFVCLGGCDGFIDNVMYFVCLGGCDGETITST